MHKTIFYMSKFMLILKKGCMSMSLLNVKRFLDNLPNDKDLQKKLRLLNKKYANRSDLGLAEKFNIIENEYLKVIREAGYDFSLKELNEYKSKEIEYEIFEDELEAVAGGKNNKCKVEFRKLYSPESICQFMFNISNNNNLEK